MNTTEHTTENLSIEATPQKTSEGSAKSNTPQLSVVIVVHDQEDVLEQNLPIFLSQTSTVTYEVIVVDDASTDDTPEVLKRLKAQYPCLYTTFMPKSVPNPSRQQLALTIGVKAAKAPWIALADIKRPPTSEAWLENLVGEKDQELIMVYSGRKHPESISCQTWTLLEQGTSLIHKAERRSGRGHRGRWIKTHRGLYDVLSVSRERVFDAIRCFDRPIRFRKLMGLRIKVWWKTI